MLLFGTSEALDQSILPVVVVAFLALGTRHIVASLERSLERLRQIASNDRRKARRLRALEQLGRALAVDGPSPAALTTLMDVLARTFGYHYASVYLWDGRVLQPGRPARLRPADPRVRHRDGHHRTCRPHARADLRAGRDPGAPTTRRPTRTWFPRSACRSWPRASCSACSTSSRPPSSRSTATTWPSMLTIADRLSAAIALGRERQKLAERAALLGRLAEAFAALGEHA